MKKTNEVKDGEVTGARVLPAPPGEEFFFWGGGRGWKLESLQRTY